MTHHRYNTIIAIAGLFSWIGLLLVLSQLDPNVSTGLTLIFLYSTMFIALSSTFTIVGFYFRVWLFKNEIFYKHINVALRQGVILALIAVFSLVFQMIKVLTWWSGLLLLFVAVLLEFYFSARDSELS